MESSAMFAGLHPNPSAVLCSSRCTSALLAPIFSDKRQFCPPSLKLQKQSHFATYSNNNVGTASLASNATLELADIDWDNLGFGFMPTDYMYIMKCLQGGDFSKGELQHFGNIELNPSAGVLNYGQGLEICPRTKAKESKY